MPAQRSHRHWIAFLLVSFFGLAVSTSLLLNPVAIFQRFSERILVVMLLYGLVCISGIMAVLFPLACSGVFGIRRRSIERLEGSEVRATKILGFLLLHGHHSPGPEAMLHEMQVGAKRYCATCFGLLTGAVMSLAFVVTYALSGWPEYVGGGAPYVLYSAGVVGVLLGFVQVLASGIRAWTRFMLSASFVIGTAFMLVATDVITADFFADVFVIALAVFWLLSRLGLSHPSQARSLRGRQ